VYLMSSQQRSLVSKTILDKASVESQMVKALKITNQLMKNCLNLHKTSSHESFSFMVCFFQPWQEGSKFQPCQEGSLCWQINDYFYFVLKKHHQIWRLIRNFIVEYWLRKKKKLSFLKYSIYKIDCITNFV
jgi:hypothetical protein